MKQLDLVTFATHSRRIPSELLLSPTQVESFSRKRLLIAHGADLWFSYFLASLFSMMAVQSIEFIMTSSGVRSGILQTTSFFFTFRMFPLVMFSYFFFSYLMNHGQSYGMYLVKKRIKMNEMSFRNAFTWAFHSTLLCFSLGLSYLFKKNIWKRMTAHDYLYHELLSHKDVTNINLLSRTKELKVSGSEEVYFKQAA
jgi:hypothetical protein